MPLGWYWAIARRPYARNLGALAYGAKSLYYATSLHEATLAGRTPAGLGFVPVDPWPGDAERGRAIMEGRFVFAGRPISMEPGISAERPGLVFEGGAALWSAPEAGRDWLAELHGFGWLRDLRVAGGLPARAVARPSESAVRATPSRSDGSASVFGHLAMGDEAPPRPPCTTSP